MVRLLWSNLFKPRIEAVGLEIGASSLKLVECTGSPPILKAYAQRPTPPGVLVGGQVVEPAALAQEIRELFLQAGVRKRYVVTAVPSQATVVRILQVPKMPLKEMEEAVRWEAERYIPFPIDEVLLDFAPLEPMEDLREGAQVQVAVAAALQETVASLVETLKSAGLIPLVIDVKPFAGLYPLEGVLEGQTSFAVEIGGSATTMVLAQGTRPLAARVLDLSGQSFTEAIARAFNLDLLAAEEVKRAYGMATIPTEDEELLLDFDLERERYSPARIYDAIRPVLVELTQEIRRSLEFFRVQLGDLEVNQGLLYGGGSKLRGLSTLLQDALGLTFQEANPWLGLQVDGKRVDPEELARLAPEFTVPVGLGIRGVSPLD
ncbi:MAG: pilus assembly protein PilM [Thermus sp.]|uniref:type IV pilus assembly protein PilM n=1 Tax=Thermus sp. TaxID=275 RepID=UPI0033310825